MPLAELLTTWKPRRDARGFVDVLHSYELTKALTAEFQAMGYPADVAQLAAGSVVNLQDEPSFDLLGTHHSDPFRAHAALRAIEAWIELNASVPAQRKAA